MKRIIPFLLSFVFCTQLFAHNIDELVFFGDSLTDNGNLYNLIKIIPKSPPYYEGRFTNGPTWAEALGAYYQDKLKIPYAIYAYGGATAAFHDPTDRFMAPITLEGELYEYYAHTFFSDKSRILYVIWIGANDYLFDDQTEPEELSSQVVDKISWAMTSLIIQGAKHFLILNLPDLSRTPFAAQNNNKEHLHLLTEMHNKKLDELIKNFNSLNDEIQVIPINIYEIFNDLLDHPEKYNQKYDTHITKLYEACWLGGLTYHQQRGKYLSELKIQLEQHLTTQHKIHINNFNSRHLNDFILKSPSLRESYLMGRMQEDGLVPCENPDQYIFWDLIHPTEVVHHALALITIEMLNNQIN